MVKDQQDRGEQALRQVRQGLWMVLGVLVLLAAFAALQAYDPGTVLAQRSARALPALLPVLIVVVFAWQQSTRRLSVKDAEMQAVLKDEFRRANLDRAFRAAFLVLLGVQVPLALLCRTLPSERAVWCMVAFSCFAGMVALLGSFLFYDRG